MTDFRKNTDGVRRRIIDAQYYLSEQTSSELYGLYWGHVVDDRDDQNQGRLKVFVYGVCAPSWSKDETLADVLIKENAVPPGLWCSPMTPSFGTTRIENNQINDETVSYGIWGPQPRKGDAVCVMFIFGDESTPIWVGCLPHSLSMLTVPGLPATQVEGSDDYLPGFERSIENPKTKIHKPAGVLAENIKTSGLADDLHRGTSISGITREAPSRVSGWKSRGNPANGMPGHVLVFDDLPDTQHVRLRTSTGNQLLLSDTAQTIYLATAKGNSRIELYENGDVEIFAEGDISYHARGDFNVAVGGNFNLDVTGNVNVNVGGAIKALVGGAFHAKTQTMFVETTDEMNFKSGGKLRLGAVDELHAKTSAAMFMQSATAMHMKSGGIMYHDSAVKVEGQGGAATAAVLATASTPPTLTSLPGAKTLENSREGTQGANVQTVASKLPQREPYARDGRIIEAALRVPEHGEPSPFDFDEYEVMRAEQSGQLTPGRSGVSKPSTGTPKDPSQGDVIENSKVKYLVVHGSAHSSNSNNVTLADIEALHRRTDKVGNRLAYHFVIRRNGMVENGVPTSPQVIHGNHTGKADYNRMSIGICMIGGGKAGDVNTGEANYTAAQLTSLRALLNRLKTQFPSVKYIVGHRDIKPTTACPSFDIQTWWASGRVDERTRSPIKPTR